MPQIHLTDAKIRSLSVADGRKEYTDVRYPNLVLRVTPRQKTWVYRPKRRPDGSRPRTTIGQYPDVSLRNAVAAYFELCNNNGVQEDPDVAKRIELLEAQLRELRISAGRGLLFSELVEDYMERCAKIKKRPKTWQNEERMLAKHALPHWGNLQVEAIDRPMIVERLETVGKSAPVQANRLTSLLRVIWQWANDAGRLDRNPIAGLRQLNPEKPRKRALSDEEIVVFWRLTETVGPVWRDAVRMLLLTLQRRSEVAGTPWSEIEDNGEWWNLPPERTKPGRDQRVFLPPPARRIIESRRDVHETPFIFSTSRGAAANPQVPIHPDQVSHIVGELSDRMVAEGFQAMRAHDLRKTAATGMTRRGVPRSIVQRILGHADGSVTGLYDLYRYDPEVEQAMSLWGETVEALVGEKA